MNIPECLTYIYDTKDKGLKPCPFCGNHKSLIIEIYILDSYSVVCDYSNNGCGASSGRRPTEYEVINTWNNRVN